MLTKSGDEGGNLSVQAADGVHTYRDSQAGLRWSPRTCPAAVRTPRPAVVKA